MVRDWIKANIHVHTTANRTLGMVCDQIITMQNINAINSIQSVMTKWQKSIRVQKKQNTNYYDHYLELDKHQMRHYRMYFINTPSCNALV